jgi:hypothetical protein
MIIVQSGGVYAQFKTIVSSLGGSRKTTIFTIPSGFTAWAVFTDPDVVVVLTIPTAPLSFATDFPQAIVVPGLGVNS